ncbi:unnamed protein product [Mytilus coruscus]|uniref:TIR domain-containing protein n=1 Tax=Mytilus coruscus TaxID=42192 RepID=A0A6J8EAX7_MYTCO|nr:unnamed protein product [Mytilus coruscus]
MNAVQTGTFYVVNWFIFHVDIIQGEPDWIVNEKVSGYGDNLTLFCLIDDCCTKASGWVKFDPDYKTIYLDVRNSKNNTSKDKYAATTNKTGFSLVIKNLQKEDINIEYSCLYGFAISREKVLLQSDAFRDDQTKSELPVAEIIIGSLIASIIILVAAVVLILKFKRNKSRRKRMVESSRKDQDGHGTDEQKLHGNTKDFFADIVIIYIDYETEGVKSFKFHLERLSKQMGYSDIIIKLFNEVFPTDPFSSYVEMETVLRNCNYAFVYISKNFNEYKKRRFGQNPCLIQNVLEKQKTNKNIKIVSNCGYWDLPCSESLTVTQDSVFLDYFHYKDRPPDDFMNNKYKETLKNLLQCIDNT